MEVKGWTTPFDQNEKVVDQKNQAEQTLELYFNDANLGPKMEANGKGKGFEEIEAATFVESAIIDHSKARKIKADKLGDSAATGISKKGKFLFFTSFILQFM